MHDDLLELFGSVANGFQARVQESVELSALGLAPFQARVLSLIARHSGCSQQEIAKWTLRDKAQVARTIKELEKRGFITRKAHVDWRAHSLGVTATGASASDLLQDVRSKLGASVLAEVTPKEHLAMREVLLKMKTALG